MAKSQKWSKKVQISLKIWKMNSSRKSSTDLSILECHSSIIREVRFLALKNRILSQFLSSDLSWEVAKSQKWSKKVQISPKIWKMNSSRKSSRNFSLLECHSSIIREVSFWLSEIVISELGFELYLWFANPDHKYDQKSCYFDLLTTVLILWTWKL